MHDFTVAPEPRHRYLDRKPDSTHQVDVMDHLARAFGYPSAQAIRYRIGVVAYERMAQAARRTAHTESPVPSAEHNRGTGAARKAR